MTAAPSLWDLFVADAALRTTRLAGGLPPPAQADDVRAACAALATDAFALGTEALLLGVEELGRLAFTAEEALDRLSYAGEADASPLRSALATALDALAAAVQDLSAPGASGALVAAGPLEDARARLAQALGAPSRGQAGPDVTATTSITDGPPAGEDDATWTPQVDEDMVDLFLEEASERIEALSGKLLELEGRPGDVELLRDIFRDLHTVKGSSGMVGLRPMNRLAHAAEDLVGQLRDGARRADRPVIDALLVALDGLRDLLARAVARGRLDLDLAPTLRRLRDPLAEPGGPPVPPASAPLVGAATPAAATPAAASAPLVGAATPAAAAPAVPVPEGIVGQPSTGPGGMPAPKQTLRVDFDKLDLLMNLVGELVLGKSGLNLGLHNLASLGRELGAERRLARKALGARSRGAAASPSPRPALPAAEVDRGADPLRVLGDELARVERVFEEVSQDLQDASEHLDHVSGELRDQVMKLRMVPIAGAFRRHHRTVRDLARALGKQARLELEGEDTELDKVLVEQLDDPLLHLVRNAVDHGIEPPAVRASAGKPPEGRIRLSARHRGNQVLIAITDDGAGIDPERLRAKALDKGVATSDELAALDERQTLELIFRPGFSTAARISEVSGRGVGMDVVREAIVSRLKGTIDITSTPGAGSTFTLRVPLTLAIIQVLLLRAGGETFAIPLDVVTRTLACAPGDVHRALDRETLAVEGRQVPLVRLRQTLGLAADEGHDDPGDALHVVLVELWGQTFGLVCERLLGKQEIVIKTLGDVLQNVPCAAGATLLGDRVALILDVPEIVTQALRPGGSPSRGDLPTTPRTGGVRVLVVEDSDTTREAIRRLFEGAGYDVRTARDGVEGLAAARAEAFDLISTDVMMPRMDGYDLTRALRAEGRHRDTPIIMVTARGEKIDRVRGFDAGVDEYITKPHDRDEILRVAASLLARRGGGGEAPAGSGGSPPERGGAR